MFRTAGTVSRRHRARNVLRVYLGGGKPMVLFGSAFLAIWFLALAFFHASGTGFNLMLLVPIATFLARSLQEARHRS
jgi:hypothetical protein